MRWNRVSLVFDRLWLVQFFSLFTLSMYMGKKCIFGGLGCLSFRVVGDRGLIYYVLMVILGKGFF